MVAPDPTLASKLFRRASSFGAEIRRSHSDGDGTANSLATDDYRRRRLVPIAIRHVLPFDPLNAQCARMKRTPWLISALNPIQSHDTLVVFRLCAYGSERERECRRSGDECAREKRISLY